MIATLPACAIQAAHRYGVSPARIEAVLTSRDRGEQAIGPMGIPPAWLPVLARHGFDIALVPIDRCSNIRAGAWILSRMHERSRPRPMPNDAPPALRMQCAMDAARAYHVGYRQIIATLTATAEARRHHRAAGIGPMGIPSRDLELLADYGFPPQAVETDTCRNMVAGIWLLGLENLGHAGNPAAVRSRPSKTPPASLLPLFRAAAGRYHLPLALLLGVASQESGFDPGATSGAGAQGVMQLMPGTARRFAVANAYDPHQAIPGAARYLVSLETKFDGRLPLVLAAYNAGGAAVEKYGDKIPPFRETEKYVPSVIGRMKFFRKWLATKFGNSSGKPKMTVAANSGKMSDGKITPENSSPKNSAGEIRVAENNYHLSTGGKYTGVISSGMEFTRDVADKISARPIARKFAADDTVGGNGLQHCDLTCTLHVPKTPHAGSAFFDSPAGWGASSAGAGKTGRKPAGRSAGEDGALHAPTTPQASIMTGAPPLLGESTGSATGHVRGHHHPAGGSGMQGGR